MEQNTNDPIKQLARSWNDGDLEAYLEMFAPDVLFLSGESWPENDPVEGRDAIREFWHEFRGVWEDVRLKVNAVYHGEEAVAGDCQWITRGRASGIEGTLEFAIVMWPKDGVVVRGQFFDELPEALAAAGLGDRTPG